MTLEPTGENPLFSPPPFPVLRDLLSLVELFLHANPDPSPNTWDELVSRGKQVNIDISEPWLGLTYSPDNAWRRVAGRIGDRPASAAAILSAAIDLIRPFDAEPQRIFTEIGERPVSAASILSLEMDLIRPFDTGPRLIFADLSKDHEDLKAFHLDRACSHLLAELRNIRHPAPPYAMDHLPSLSEVHAGLLLTDPDWEPLSSDAGWLGVFRGARHDLSIAAGFSDNTWQRLRLLLRNHGAAVAVVIASASHETGGSRHYFDLLRQIMDRASRGDIHLDRILADLLASSRRPSAAANHADGVTQ